MNESQLYAYLAGLIDGDGSVILSISRRKRRLTDIGVSPQLKIEITHRKSKELFSMLVGEVGGYYRYEKKKRAWMYTFKGLKNLAESLTKLEPYLFLKQEQAKLLIQAITLMRETHRPGHPRQKDTLLELIDLSYKIRKLNQPRSGATGNLKKLNKIEEYVKTQYDEHLAEIEYRIKHHQKLHPEFGEHK